MIGNHRRCRTPASRRTGARSDYSIALTCCVKTLHFAARLEKPAAMSSPAHRAAMVTMRVMVGPWNVDKKCQFFERVENVLREADLPSTQAEVRPEPYSAARRSRSASA